jgi:hypothetical protein
MAKDNKNPAKRTTPDMQLVSDDEYGETMKRLMDIQIAADAAVKSINNLKALIVETF